MKRYPKSKSALWNEYIHFIVFLIAVWVILAIISHFKGSNTEPNSESETVNINESSSIYSDDLKQDKSETDSQTEVQTSDTFETEMSNTSPSSSASEMPEWLQLLKIEKENALTHCLMDYLTVSQNIELTYTHSSTSNILFAVIPLQSGGFLGIGYDIKNDIFSAQQSFITERPKSYIEKMLDVKSEKINEISTASYKIGYTKLNESSEYFKDLINLMSLYNSLEIESNHLDDDLNNSYLNNDKSEYAFFYASALDECTITSVFGAIPKTEPIEIYLAIDNVFSHNISQYIKD